jgi:hypothetical protein
MHGLGSLGIGDAIIELATLYGVVGAVIVATIFAVVWRN